MGEKCLTFWHENNLKTKLIHLKCQKTSDNKPLKFLQDSHNQYLQ